MKLQKLIVLFIIIFCAKTNAQSTASKQVSTFIIDAPQLETQKKIWVYLPKDYQDTDISYPVIYMHDAQNLFDDKTSFVGEWKVDEYLDSINNWTSPARAPTWKRTRSPGRTVRRSQ